VKIKKVILITTAIVSLVLGASLYVQRIMLPGMIAKSLRSEEEESILIPEGLKPTILKTRKELNRQMDSIPSLMNSLNLTFDDLIYIAETLDANQVLQSINELNRTDLKNTNQAFDIVKKNIVIEGFDLETFRPAFNKKVNLKKIKNALRKINDNNLTTTVSIPIARETVKQVLYDNREKIERNLDSKR